MRLHVAMIDTCSWEEAVPLAAEAVSSGLLLSHGIRRDTGVYVVLRCGDTYSWLYVDGGRVRNLRPDAESSEGLIRSFLRGRGRDAARLGRGLPKPRGMVVEVAVGSVLGAELPREACRDVFLLYNHRGEYNVGARVTLPPPRRLLGHAVAMANILLDRLCSERRVVKDW